MKEWNSVLTGVEKAADTAIRKTGLLADTASIYVRMKATQAKLDGYYTALGKYTYRQLKTGEQLADKIAGVLKNIDTERAKMTALQNQLVAEKEKRKSRKEEAETSEKAEKIKLEISGETLKAETKDIETSDDNMK